MKKRVLSLLMALALCLTLLPTAALAEDAMVSVCPDDIDANGETTKMDGDRDGFVYSGSNTDEFFTDNKPYVVQANAEIVIKGNLTIGGEGSLILGKGATLTVEGALIHNGGNKFYIYGASNRGADAGELIINNSYGNGAAVRSNAAQAPRLGICSGEVTIIGNGSDKLVENVVLYSTKPMHMAIRDKNVLLPSEWSGSQNTSISGSELAIEYCDHPGEYVAYTRYSDTQHYMTCTLCGFNTGASSRKYANCGSNGFERWESTGDGKHRKVCACGNLFGEAESCEPKTLWTLDGKGHTTMCGDCGYTPEGGTVQPHSWNAEGECTDCGFLPILEGVNTGNLYDNLDEALENGETELTLVSHTTDKVVASALKFDTDAAITLNMGDCKLTSTRGTALSVSKGTLTVKGDAVINQTATSPELVSSAISVTGGELIFEGNLTATGGSSSSKAASAIEVSGDTVTFKGTVNAEAQIINTTAEVVLSPAINVTGGTVTFEKKLTATGGGNNAGGNKPEQQPAVYAKNGTLDFQDDLDLNGGLTITGDAILRTKLSKGTFTAMPSSDAKRVSVVGSKNYTYLRDLLKDGYVFFDKGNNRYLVFSDTDWSGDTAIIAHEHNWEKPASGDIYECTICGKPCAHEGGYKTGKCEVCGKPCPHAIADAADNYRCRACNQQMVARIQTGQYDYAHFTDLPTAMDAAENGQTILLLHDVDNSGKYALLTGDNKTVTLDLNGHTINGGWMQVGIDRNWENYTSTTLKVIGNGSIKTIGNLSVGYSATLDLSGWTGGTISKVNPSKKGDDESTLIVGENAGTIENLNIFSWPTDENDITYINKTTLRGGSYGQISITMNSPTGANKYIPFSSMLAKGYAFQYTESGAEPGEFLDYAIKAEYASGGRKSINNVKVVECPHADAEDGRCLYCNEDGIAATVDDIFYDLDHVNDAIAAWLDKDGSTLKLFTDASTDELDLSSAAADSLTIDLNGHSFTKTGDPVTLSGGKSLTIMDSKEKTSSNGAFSPIKADSGTLTLKSGYLEGLNIPSSSTADISLEGGKVSCITNYPLPAYNLLGEGCYLLSDSGLLEPTEAPDPNATYTVKKASVYTSSASPNSVEMGENRVPLSLTAFVSEDDVTQVQFRWYLLKENGTTARLIQSDVQALDSGWGTPYANYDGNYTYSNSSEDVGWNDLNVGGPYNLVLVVTGKDADGENKWHTAFTGFQMSLTAANLENAEITFKNTSKRITFNPFGDTTATPDVDFTVTCYGKTLKYGEDYTVSGNTTKNGVGYYDLTISAAPTNSNYTGTKTVRWEVEEYILSHLALSSATITKKYDGTADLPAGSVTSNFISRDESVKDLIPLQLGTDYTLGETSYKVFDETANNYVDSPNVGSGKTVYCEVTLLSKNYRAGYGGKQLDWYFYASEVNASITKADALTVTKTGALTIVNGLAASYTVDLTELLPALKAPCEYGEITYGNPNFTAPDLAEGESYSVITSVNKDGVLTFKLISSSGLRTGEIGTVTIPVTTTNYEGFSLTVNVSAVNKPQPTVTATAEPDTIIYGTTLADVTLTATAAHEGNNVSGTIAWNDPSTKLTVGDHEVEWTFRPEDTDHYRAVSGTVRIHVDKATPAGEPKYTAIEASGKKLADAALGVNDSWPAGSVKWVDANGNELAADTVVKPNTAYRWIFTPDDSNNYNGIEGSITLYHYSVDIPDAPTYPVNVPDDTGNGTVTVNPKNAPKGSTVTITVKPDSGYQLGDLIVTDKDGNQLPLTDKGDGKYTFVMPNGTVNVRGSFVVKTEESPFRDVSTGAYYYDAVKWAVGKDITSGIGNGLFGPNQSCTRAQIATFLWRAAGSPEPTALSSFTDVAPTAYYAKAVAWAVENGITTGTSATEFSPNAPCTRAQAVTFLYRALKAAASGSSTAFSDVAADAYYASAVAWAVENGVTTGVGGGLFAPKDTCTRAQIVTFLYRAYQGK